MLWNFMFLVPRVDVRCDFCIKIMFGSSLSPFVCFIDVLCIDIHVAYWCLTRFSFHMMFVSFNSTRRVSLVELIILNNLTFIYIDIPDVSKYWLRNGDPTQQFTVYCICTDYKKSCNKMKIFINARFNGSMQRIIRKLPDVYNNCLSFQSTWVKSPFLHCLSFQSTCSILVSNTVFISYDVHVV